MSDNKMLVGNPDRKRVSAEEDYEVSYLAQKFDLPAPLVRRVIEQEGPMRQAVEEHLARMKAPK